MHNIKRCSRCCLPENWSITLFDDQGVCNFCRYYDTVRDKLRDFDRWEKLFREHLDQHKGKYEYDAVVGFSGGKDSSYIVHKLKTHYQCNVLAVTVNFGFMPTDFAIENSKRVAKSLEVDHILYDATSDEIKSGFESAIKKSRLCGLCTALCTAFTRKIAIEKGIPFFILGADRGQMMRELSPETAPVSGASNIARMLMPYSVEKTLRQEPIGQVKGIRRWLNNFGFSKQTALGIYPDSKPLSGTDALPLSLQFFAFHDYQEKEIKRILVEEANWELPKNSHLHSHHDCDFHDAAIYGFRQANGKTITVGEICVDVREGVISKEEALEALRTEEERLNQMQQPYEAYQNFFGIPNKYPIKASQKFGKQIRLIKRLRKIQLLFFKPKIKAFDHL